MQGEVTGPATQVQEQGQLGTHRPAWAPGAGPTSVAQAGTRRAATAAADDLQLALRTVGPLKELLDELLQPQLGAGLPSCRLLQELVDLHHLPGPRAVPYPSARAWLPTQPREETRAVGRDMSTAARCICSQSCGYVQHRSRHSLLMAHTEKQAHSLGHTLHTPPTQPHTYN